MAEPKIVVTRRIPEPAVEMLREAGFTHVRVETLPHDPLNYFYVATRG